jgi:hypothetical protein
VPVVLLVATKPDLVRLCRPLLGRRSAQLRTSAGD